MAIGVGDELLSGSRPGAHGNEAALALWFGRVWSGTGTGAGAGTAIGIASSEQGGFLCMNVGRVPGRRAQASAGPVT